MAKSRAQMALNDEDFLLKPVVSSFFFLERARYFAFFYYY